MMGRIRAFYQKYKQIIRYLFFGVVTTAVSLAACFLTLKVGVAFLHDENGEPTELLDVIGSTVQWVSGVIVAFVTNKLWVFDNSERGFRKTLGQLGVFSASRVGTYFLEVVLNLACIKLLVLIGYKTVTLTLAGLDVELSARLWAKLIAAVFVVISNYYISKIVVFRKKKGVGSEKARDNVK